jgi:hypothetical protein
MLLIEGGDCLSEKGKQVFEVKGIKMVAYGKLPTAKGGIKKPEYVELIEKFVGSGESFVCLEGLNKSAASTLRAKAEGKPVTVCIRGGKIWLKKGATPKRKK